MDCESWLRVQITMKIIIGLVFCLYIFQNCLPFELEKSSFNLRNELANTKMSRWTEMPPSSNRLLYTQVKLPSGSYQIWVSKTLTVSHQCLQFTNIGINTTKLSYPVSLVCGTASRHPLLFGLIYAKSSSHEYHTEVAYHLFLLLSSLSYRQSWPCCSILISMCLDICCHDEWYNPYCYLHSVANV